MVKRETETTNAATPTTTDAKAAEEAKEEEEERTKRQKELEENGKKRTTGKEEYGKSVQDTAKKIAKENARKIKEEEKKKKEVKEETPGGATGTSKATATNATETSKATGKPPDTKKGILSSTAAKVTIAVVGFTILVVGSVFAYSKNKDKIKKFLGIETVAADRLQCRGLSPDSALPKASSSLPATTGDGGSTSSPSSSTSSPELAPASSPSESKADSSPFISLGGGSNAPIPPIPNKNVDVGNEQINDTLQYNTNIQNNDRVGLTTLLVAIEKGADETDNTSTKTVIETKEGSSPSSSLLTTEHPRSQSSKPNPTTNHSRSQSPNPTPSSSSIPSSILDPNKQKKEKEIEKKEEDEEDTRERNDTRETVREIIDNQKYTILETCKKLLELIKNPATPEKEYNQAFDHLWGNYYSLSGDEQGELSEAESKRCKKLFKLIKNPATPEKEYNQALDHLWSNYCHILSNDEQGELKKYEKI